MKLFLMAVKTSNPVVMENITLPCLRILHHLVKPPQPTSKKNKVLVREVPFLYILCVIIVSTLFVFSLISFLFFLYFFLSLPLSLFLFLFLTHFSLSLSLSPLSSLFPFSLSLSTSLSLSLSLPLYSFMILIISFHLLLTNLSFFLLLFSPLSLLSLVITSYSLYNPLTAICMKSWIKWPDIYCKLCMFFSSFSQWPENHLQLSLENIHKADML